jgi:hypothetical protein
MAEFSWVLDNEHHLPAGSDIEDAATNSEMDASGC